MQTRWQTIVFLIEGLTDMIATKQPWNDNIYIAKELSRSLSLCILEQTLTCIFFANSRCVKTAYSLTYRKFSLAFRFLKRENTRDKFTLKDALALNE